MRLEVRFTVESLNDLDLAGATVVVVDVLRASSCMVEALMSGASGIYPTGSTEEAIKLIQSIGRDDTLLCGERRGEMIEGYHLGNSPGEFTPEVVKGQRLIMNTTNGTRVFAAVEAADRVVVASFLNLGAVTRAVDRADRLVVACAGRSGAFALEDVMCAGHLVRRLRATGAEPFELDDGARAAEALTDSLVIEPGWLRDTESGRALLALGLDADLESCARLDVHDVVPELRDRALRARHGS
ncbi:MAG: 2-phosphosulfolactate phosphatase [Gemmatimonadetes bacterium]|nr:2-phosphosulfolactate phosphatase [Gemmatimonadota bacterium]MBT8403728.1 2-phosphosulfolactate phosphatase [Gemmatimonadota bacterium]NNF39369.1 2-phosphosulfolactate phosphatase [Gemmatimonadota bacterium]NNK62543.1 2-phosphosulfolactate phosphatase [Gemmatimonadota bacterium]